MPAALPAIAVHTLHRSSSVSEYENRCWNAFRFGQYRVLEPLFQKVSWLAEEFGLPLEVDAFASKAHRRLPRYWSSHTDAFQKYWGDLNLWINPPLNTLAGLLRKFFAIKLGECC
jgi:hypothetical protein